MRQQIMTLLAIGLEMSLIGRLAGSLISSPHNRWTMLDEKERRDGDGKPYREQYFMRPGKEHKGTSATVNYKGTDMLYVFSTERRTI